MNGEAALAGVTEPSATSSTEPSAGTNYTRSDVSSNGEIAQEYWLQTTATSSNGPFTNSNSLGYGDLMAAIAPQHGGACTTSVIGDWGGGTAGNAVALADLNNSVHGNYPQPNASRIDNKPGWTISGAPSSSILAYQSGGYHPFNTTQTCPFYTGTGSTAAAVGLGRNLGTGNGDYGVNNWFFTFAPKVQLTCVLDSNFAPQGSGGAVDSCTIFGGDNQGTQDYVNLPLYDASTSNFSVHIEVAASGASPSTGINVGTLDGSTCTVAVLTYVYQGDHSITVYQGSTCAEPLSSMTNLGTLTATGSVSGGGYADRFSFFSGGSQGMTMNSAHWIYIGAWLGDYWYGGPTGW